MSDEAKKSITPSEAGYQRELLKDLYQKELIAKFKNSNGFDKVFLVEQVSSLFANYKISKENMDKVEKKLAKQFDINYMKKFQMKQAQIIDDKKSKTQLLSARKLSAAKLTINNESAGVDGTNNARGKDKMSDGASLGGEAPADLDKMWEKENAKLRAQKLKAQEERRRELDEQKKAKEQAVSTKRYNLKTAPPLVKSAEPIQPVEIKPKSERMSEKQSKSHNDAPSIAASLADSDPCDLKKLWEKENAKLRAEKLKAQEARRRDLDAQKNTREEDVRREKQEDVQYMRDVRKDNRRLDRLDREKAKEYQRIIDEDAKQLKELKAEKRRAEWQEAKYDLNKHNEMMEIVEKENKIEERKLLEKGRQMRKLLRNQIRDMRQKENREKENREMEMKLEAERNRVYGEIEEARLKGREAEVNARENRAKKVMNAYHERYGKAIEELALQDEKNMFKAMRQAERKADNQEKMKAARMQEARIDLKKNLFIQMDEKAEKDQLERDFDAENTQLRLHNLRDEGVYNGRRPATAAAEGREEGQGMAKSGTAGNVNKIKNTRDDLEMYEFTKKMNANELLLNKNKLKFIASQSTPALAKGRVQSAKFKPSVVTAVKNIYL